MQTVLIATPSYDGKRYCFRKYLDALNNIDYPANKLNFLMIDNTPLGKDNYKEIPLKFNSEIIRLYGKTHQLNSREVIAYSYSVIFCYAEGYNFDYLLLLESDVIIPEDGLSKLIETSKTHSGLIVPLVFRDNGKYLQAYHDDMTLWKHKGKDRLYRTTRTPYRLDEINKPVVHIGSAAFSCVLILLKYLKQLKINWYQNHYNHPDGFFYDKVKQLGIPVWLDSRVKCKHLQRPWNKEVIW